MTKSPAIQDPRELAAQLATARDLEAARRADELTRRAAAAAHDRSLADVGEVLRQAELDRAQRAEQAAADADLARLYRSARTEGERIRIKATMARSAEARALRLESTRAWTQRILLPLYLGFGAWSTAGVQAGLVRMTGAQEHSFVWWASWFIEPVLIIAAGVLIWARARIRASGGDLGGEAMLASALCLTASIALNLMSAHTLKEAAAKAIAPCFAALMAWLSGLVDDAVAKADPWTELQGGKRVKVRLLSELIPAEPVTVSAVRSDIAPDIEAFEALSDVRPVGQLTAPQVSDAGPDIQPMSEPVSDAPAQDVSDEVSEGVSDVRPEPVSEAPAQDVSDDRPVSDALLSVPVSEPVSEGASDSDGGGVRTLVLSEATGHRTSTAAPLAVTGQLVVADGQRDTQVMAWLAADQNLSGADIARRLGVTPRTGQRLRNRALELLKEVS
jgi:hypothetical protein